MSASPEDVPLSVGLGDHRVSWPSCTCLLVTVQDASSSGSTWLNWLQWIVDQLIELPLLLQQAVLHLASGRPAGLLGLMLRL